MSAAGPGDDRAGLSSSESHVTGVHAQLAAAVAGDALEDLVVLQLRVVPRVDGGRDEDPVGILGVQHDEAGVVVLGAVQVAAGFGDLVDAPAVAVGRA